VFNGFVSQWSNFLTPILGSRYAPYLAVCAVLAMLTSVLTLALFLQFVGASFLSRVRRRVAERAAAGRATDGGRLMVGPQIALAALCLLLGLAPSLGYQLIHRAVVASPDGLGRALGTLAPMQSAGLTGVAGPEGVALLSPLAVGGVFAALVAVAAGISVLGGAVRRPAEPWLCGYVAESDQTRYGARNLYREVARYFPWVGQSSAAPGGNGAGRRPEPTPQEAGSPSSHREA